MTTVFHGRERIGFEICGTVPRDAARECAGGGLSLDGRGGAVPVSLLVVALQDVRADAFPAVKLDWVQALWRVGVVVREKPTWLVYQVDVNGLLARLACGMLLSYPTRRGAMHFKDASRQVDVVVAAQDKTLLVRAETHTGTPARAQDKRRMIVRHGPRFYEIPWDHAAPTSRMAASANVAVQDLAEETFGHGVAWDEEAILWKERPHGCGRPVPLPVL